MGYLGSGRGAGEAGDARVAKQVQDARLAQGPDPPVEPLPVGGLLGEEGEVAEGREPAGEAHVAPGQGEGVDRIAGKTPAAALVLVGRIEHGVGGVKGGRIARGPEALGFRPDHGEAAIAFQLAAVAAVQKGVIGPGAGDQGFRRRVQTRRHRWLIGGEARSRPAPRVFPRRLRLPRAGRRVGAGSCPRRRGYGSAARAHGRRPG